MIESGQSNPEAQKEAWKNLVESGAYTLGRENRPNQDRFLSDPEAMKFAVIDGMGGHVHGEVAAQTALTLLQKYRWPEEFNSVQALEEMKAALLRANDKVLFVGEKPEYKPKSEKEDPMGAVVAAVKLFRQGSKTMAAIGHVGDCRVYKLNQRGELEHLTLDDGFIRSKITHSEERALLAQSAFSNVTNEQELGEFGKAANASENKNAVSQYLGKEDIEPHARVVELLEGESLLIFSDGLKNLRDDEILRILLRGGSTQDRAQLLVQEAVVASRQGNFWNHKDDITAVVVENKAPPQYK